MNAKKWTLLVAMIGALLVTAFAKDKDEIRDERRARMELRREYFKENIKPKVDAQRTEFESKISAEDKKEISRLREEIISQRLMQNENYFEARAMRIKGEEVDESLIDEIESQRISIENLYDKAKLIANKYRPEIDDVVADLREDIRKDFKEHRNEEGRPEKHGGREWRGQGRGDNDMHGMRGRGGHGPRGGFGRGEMPRLDLVGFLLWDVNRG